MASDWYTTKCGGPGVRALDDGTFEVDGVGVPVTAINSAVASYAPSVWKYAVQYGVPPQIIAGVMMRESWGKATIVAPDGGLGLMQLTSADAKQGHSNEELLSNPDLNIQLGARLLGKLWNESGGNPISTLTSYNRGYVQCGGKNPWNVVNTNDYVGGTLGFVNGAVKHGAYAPGADPNAGLYPSDGPIATETPRAVWFALGMAVGVGGWYLWRDRARLL